MYIGNTPAENYASFLTETFTVSATASYTLSHAVTNENDIRLVINGVVQQPGSGKAYTASGTTLTLTSATVSGDVMYAVYLGRALQTVNPPNASVGSAQVADSLISGKTALASEPADTDEFLVSDAGTLKRIDYSLIKGGGITEADQWRLTAQASGNQTPFSTNLERVDTDGFGYLGTGMTQSSGIFTFPSTGVYKIEFDAHYTINGVVRNINTIIATTTDNSSYSDAAYSNSSIVQAESNFTAQSGHASFIFNVTNTSTHKVRFETNSTQTTLTQADTNANTTYMTFIRLGDSV